MSRLIPTLLVLILGVAGYLWFASEPAPQPNVNGPKAGTGESNKSDQGKTNPDLKGDRPDPDKGKASKKEQPKKDDMAKQPDDKLKVAADLAAIGLTPEHAAFVVKWTEIVKTEQQQCLDVFADGGEPQQAAKDFNKIMDGHRQRLISALGKDQAGAVLRKRALYKFELRSGTWFRQDADGQPAAFQDPGKEDIWVNFKKRDG